MNADLRGTRPRPRVALLGQFKQEDVEHLQRLFPTLWVAPNIRELYYLTHVSELDLIIIAPGVDETPGWTKLTHVINFSSDLKALPGPIDSHSMIASNPTLTDEFVLPDAPLPLDRRRKADLSDVTSTKGWRTLHLTSQIETSSKQNAVSKRIFASSALVREHLSGMPLALAFQRYKTALGVAWLPSPPFDRIAWIRVLVTQWAKDDPVRFPSFSDWTKQPDWLSKDEQNLLSQLASLEKERRIANQKFDRAAADLTDQLVEAQCDANEGTRRLLTAQGEELVDEVVTTLRAIGFDVEKVDDTFSDRAPKREDLRLTDPNDSMSEWEAIVEVRGYKRSGGTTSDLSRLGRFAELYMREKGHFPSKRIYVVNGQIEVLPPQRQPPLASADEDVAVFAEQDGLLISSVSLFQAAREIQDIDPEALRESVKDTAGRWHAPEPCSAKDTDCPSG